jgi:hypothetical protein
LRQKPEVPSVSLPERSGVYQAGRFVVPASLLDVPETGMVRSRVVNHLSAPNGYFPAPLHVLTDRFNLRPDNLEELCARRPVSTILRGVVRVKLLYDQGTKTLEPVIVRRGCFR